MNGYFYTLIITSVCGSLCTLLVSGGFEKYIKYVVALICTVLMLLPISKLDLSEIQQTVNELPEISDMSQGLYPIATQMTESRAEEYISQMVFSEFGINPIYTHIEIDWEQPEPIIQSIKIALDSENVSKSKEIKKYLKDVLGGEVEIVEN